MDVSSFNHVLLTIPIVLSRNSTMWYRAFFFKGQEEITENMVFDKMLLNK